MSQLVILGRDGVINQVVEGGVLSPKDFQAIPGSLEAIARLNHAGLRIAVATNQPGIARNLLTIETLGAIHARRLEKPPLSETIWPIWMRHAEPGPYPCWYVVARG